MGNQWLRDGWDSLCDNHSKNARIIVFATIGLPVLLLVVLVALWGVNVPFWDQWELVPLFQKFHNGTLGFADFFAQHNEHRILFPRLITFCLAWLTHWNIYYELATSIVLATITFLFLYNMLQRTFAKRGFVLLAACLTSAILFSPLQWESWLWGWQIQWFLNVAGLVVSLWALSVWRARLAWRFVVAASAATVATYSLASGSFVWVVCLLLFVPKTSRRWLWLWLITGAGVVSSHYIGYHDPAYHPSKTLFLHEPVTFVKYVVTYISKPVAPDFRLSYLLGLFLFGAMLFFGSRLFMARRKDYPLVLPWICLGGYGLLAAIFTAISRLGFGVEQAYSSRYVTLSNCILLAVCVLLLQCMETKLIALKVKRAAGIVLLMIAVLVGINYGKGTIQMYHQHVHLVEARQCLQSAQSADDACLLLAYPNQQVVWQRLEYLRKIHWGGQ
jgi:hypothetical protein